MPKKAKKVKIRRKWAINPKTRVRQSETVYKRHLEKLKIRKETTGQVYE